MIWAIFGVIVFLGITIIGCLVNIGTELHRAATAAERQVKLSEDVNRMQTKLLELTEQGAKQMDSMQKARQN